jgi:hypothetical protein
MQNTDTDRLLGMIAALGSEVFVLKAEVQRLKHALGVTQTLLDKAGASPELERWMSEEQAAFGAALMRPFTHPDEARDVSKMMAER